MRKIGVMPETWDPGARKSSGFRRKFAGDLAVELLPRRTDGHVLRVLRHDLLDHGAVPADRRMRLEDLRKRFRGDFGPEEKASVRRPQARTLIGPCDLADRLAARDARPPLVPARDEGADEAFARPLLDLTEALLSAALLLGPARALRQAQVRVPMKHHRAAPSASTRTAAGDSFSGQVIRRFSLQASQDLKSAVPPTTRAARATRRAAAATDMGHPRISFGRSGGPRP